MNIIETTKDLKDFCKECKGVPYLAIDTEFIRRKTYRAILCLIQVNNGKRSVAIDPFAVKDLKPFYKLINNSPKTVKILHASNQDLEIFFHESGKIPTNLFDTQIGAMVCGFQENIGYAKLVDKICKKTIEKEYQYSEWQKRPLNDKQVKYALQDVDYLPAIYFYLNKEIKKTGRSKWIENEVKILQDKNTYKPNPDECWKKIKTRAQTPQYLAVLKELASIREKMAIQHNIPKTFIMSDDRLLKLSLMEKPNASDIAKRHNITQEMAQKLIDALKKGRKTKLRACPTIVRRKKTNKPLEHMLKLILTLVSDDLKVAGKLIASSDDIADLASRYPEKDNPCLKGWKYEAFGKYVDGIKAGKVKVGMDKHGRMRIFQ